MAIRNMDKITFDGDQIKFPASAILQEDLEGDISELKSDLTAKFQKVIGKNLVDTSKTVTGAIQSNGTVATNGSWATYKTSDYIELEENTDYSYACYLESTLAVQSSSRKTLLLYNASKEPVSASYVSATRVDNVTLNSGTAYKYARVSYNPDAEVIPQFEEGTTATSYQAYTSADYLLTKLGATPMSQIAERYDTLFNSVMPFPLDLHDSTTDVVGVLYSNGTINTGGTSYHTSDYIRVLKGYKYVLDHPRNIAYYDDSKAFDSFIDNSSNAKYTYSATADGYIRFSYSNSAVSTAVTVIFDGTYTKKIDEKIDLSIRQKDTVKDIVEETSGNILYGKKWVVCGDSFTNGATETTIATGKYAGKRYVYPYLIGNRNNMEIVQFFGGGRTLAFPAVPDDFVNSLCCSTETFYYQNIPADADYITIYLGINDEHHAPSSSGGDGEDNTGEIPIGTVDDNTVNTYLGAWNVVLTWLIANRPNAHIGMLVTNGNQSKDEYRQGQIAIATKYGIPYIDLNGDARTPAMIRTSNPNIPSAVKTALINKWAVDPDGTITGTENTHPNDNAHLFESTVIEAFLRSI